MEMMIFSTYRANKVQNMIEKANANKAKIGNPKNIAFIQAVITSIPLASNIADCIISNCVINLVPSIAEKRKVFHEIFRLLKPGGRVAISDIMARKEMTHEMKTDLALYVGCISGASLISEYEDFLEEAGFESCYFPSPEGTLLIKEQILSSLTVRTT